MHDVTDDEPAREFLATIRLGDRCSGTVAAVSRGVSVTLDGFPARPLGFIGPLDMSWRHDRASAMSVAVGERITAEVTAVDPGQGRVLLSRAAAEDPELWGFLKSLRVGAALSGTVASIEPFGVFVALDAGPAHPVFPGVGFISMPELSWTRFEDASDVVRVGQQVTCEFLQFDTWNGEARLSLRATLPDPFRAFADGTAVGQALEGRVTKLVPFGAFVEVAPGIEGLVHVRDLAPEPVRAPEEVVQVGDSLTVAVTELDRERRRLALTLSTAGPDAR
ncbi:S1 RNA-binding domain-containing protein [Streptomyces erythrochromogenes]|uniref:S1 RNA-binding domain-containing protein n=1 Tax=Streptomyces erythrochromogenes TaxID=285574 RepID=UPI00341BC4BE